MVLLLLILSACSMCREFGAAPRELLILRWIHNIAIENREREDEDEVHRFIAVHHVFSLCLDTFLNLYSDFRPLRFLSALN